MGLCDGRVAIVTGAGRGIGREHALSLAGQGAKVVVNDLGGNIDGTGGDLSPAQQVVEEIAGMGGEAVANGDDVSTWEGAQRLVNTAVETFGDLHVLVNNAGILRDRMLDQHDRGGVGRGHQGAPQGHLRPGPLGGRLLAGAGQGRQGGRRPHHQHHVGVGHLRQPRPDQLRRGQGRHRRVHGDRRARAGPLRRHGQRRRAGGPHPHDRGPRPGAGDRRGARDALAPLDRPHRHLAGLAGVEGRHRPGVRGVGPGPGHRRGLAPRARARARRGPDDARARSWPTCWPRPGSTPAWTARTAPGPSRPTKCRGPRRRHAHQP